MRGTNVEERVAREALFGSLPILSNERLYGFVDALLLLSGYCIATWSYTQGAYLATLVGFRQLLLARLFRGHFHAVYLSAAGDPVGALRHRHLGLAAGGIRWTGALW